MKLNEMLMFRFLIVVGICLGGYYSVRCQVIEKPVFAVRNNTRLEIDRIVLNDTATLVYMKSPRDKMIPVIKQDAYLQAMGEKYKLKEVRGIKNVNFRAIIQADSHTFELEFPALPEQIDEVDCILETQKSPVGIWGIQLGDKRLSVNEQVPEAIRNRKIDMKREWSPVGLAGGVTSLEIHFLGYRPGMQESVGLYWMGLASGKREYPISDQGIVCAEFSQYGVMSVQFLFGETGNEILLFPGEKNRLYVDMVEATRRKCVDREAEPVRPVFYCSGHYEDLNTILMNQPLRYNREQFPANLNEKEYMNFCRKEYRDKIQWLEKTDTLSREWAYFQKLKALQNLLGRVNQAQYYLAGNINRSSADAQPLNLDYYKIFQDLSLNNYELMVMGASGNEINQLLRRLDTEEKLKTYLNVEEGYLVDMLKVTPFDLQFKMRMPFTEEQLEKMKGGSPFLNKMILELQDEYLRYETERKTQSGFRKCAIPEVTDEKLFDAILEQYKGKVVFVDFWATWCGPCLGGIKAMEPVKKELQKEGVVFVYLTSESSPLKDWEWQIADIKGEHYRLTAKQWQSLGHQLGISGIPAYWLVKKNGERERYSGGSDKLKERVAKGL